MASVPTDSAVLDALRTVIDPELGVNVVDLGLVYRIDHEDQRVHICMTMTSPACPLGEYLKEVVETTVKDRVEGVSDVEVSLVWDPPWSPEMMSAGARREIGPDE